MVPWASHFALGSFLASAWKTSTNSRPMILRLASGVATPLEMPHELFGGIHVDDLDAQIAGKGPHDLVGLVQAQKAVVDKHAGQLVADGPVQSAATTEESTPPESPRMTSSSPTWVRTFWMASFT